MLDIIPTFNRQMGTDFPEDDVAFKLNIQSPGFIELIIPGIGILLGVLAVSLAGGDISWKISKDEVSGNIKTPGIFKALTDFQDAKQRRQMSEEMLQLNDKLHSLSQQLGAVYPTELDHKSTPPHEPENSDD